MRWILVALGIWMLAKCAEAQQKIVQYDPILGPQHHKQQYIVEGNRIIPYDPILGKQYHKQQSIAKEGKQNVSSKDKPAR